MSEWPVTEGRYKVGDPDSPVAICTMASIDLVDKIPQDGVAIVGKAVTENLGVEKIVKNIVANPKIRFLILCGAPSKGHMVGQTIMSLIQNGIDETGRIIGAKGPMPVMKNVSREEVETFRKQVEPVNLMKETSVDKIMAAVEECKERNPGPFQEAAAKPAESDVKEMVASHDEKEYVPDPKGFFTIHLDRGGGNIVVEHHTQGKKLLGKIVGKTAEELYHTIVREGLVSRLEHASYLGRELAKAELALKHNLEYEQDSPTKPAKYVYEEFTSRKITYKTYVLSGGEYRSIDKVVITEEPEDERRFKETIKKIGMSILR